MPFDMTPYVETEEGMIYQRLLILRELLPKSGSQENWCTCVWNEVRTDPRLRAMGVEYAPMGSGPRVKNRALFGRLGMFVKRDSSGAYTSIFGTISKEEKRHMLNNEIRRLRRRRTAHAV